MNKDLIDIYVAYSGYILRPITWKFGWELEEEFSEARSEGLLLKGSLNDLVVKDSGYKTKTFLYAEMK